MYTSVIISLNTRVCRRSVDNKAAILSHPILSYWKIVLGYPEYF